MAPRVLALTQDYVPVIDDRRMFVGIVTKQRIFECYNHTPGGRILQ